MPWLETESFAVEVPAGWKYRNARVAGAGNCLLAAVGLSCLVAGWALGRFGTAGVARWFLVLGAGAVLIATFVPLVYSLLWFRTREMRTGLPRLLGDLRNKGLLAVGPEGQWFHLTADDLRPGERPMDSHELEESMRKRYGDRVVEQGWLPVGTIASGPIEAGTQHDRVGFRFGSVHWFTYRLVVTLHKKYTSYIRSGEESQVEVIVTARLGDPPNPVFERQYDEIVRSIRVGRK